MGPTKSDQMLDPNWVPYGGKTLHTISAAYRAYIKLVAPPAAAPIFESDKNHHPIVEMGEVFCLLKHKGRRHCGHKALGRNFLQRHLESVHGRLAENRRGKLAMDIKAIERARRHYVHCMIDMDYEGKEIEGAEMSNHRPMATSSILQTEHQRQSQGGSVENPPSLPVDSTRSGQHQKSRSRAKRDSTSNPITDNVISLDSEDEDLLRHIKTKTIDSPTSDRGALQAHGKKIKASTESSHRQSSRLSIPKADHSRVMKPTPISLDSDSETEDLPIKSEERGSAVVKGVLEEPKMNSDVEDLELEVEEAEAQLRSIAAKRKLMARKKRRQERG